MEPDDEFLDILITKDVFSTEAIDEIKAAKIWEDRNEKILYYLRYVDEDRLNSFLSALRDSSQIHVVNFINGDLTLCLEVWYLKKASQIEWLKNTVHQASCGLSAIAELLDRVLGWVTVYGQVNQHDI